MPLPSLRKYLLLSALIVALIISLSGWLAPKTALAAAPSSPDRVEGITRKHGSSPRIALTFDDGPEPGSTARILAILRQYQTPATFFTIGQKVQKYPWLVRQEYAAGHAIGNHTWNHAELTKLPPDQQASEIAQTSSVLKQVTGVAPTLIRPPYGSVNESVREQIAAQHLTMVLWDVDTVDWTRPGSSAIIQTALTHAHNGAIILMHDGGGDRSQTAEALPTIITTLRQRGYTLVTVPQLLQGR